VKQWLLIVIRISANCPLIYQYGLLILIFISNNQLDSARFIFFVSIIIADSKDLED